MSKSSHTTRRDLKECHQHQPRAIFFYCALVSLRPSRDNGLRKRRRNPTSFSGFHCVLLASCASEQKQEKYFVTVFFRCFFLFGSKNFNSCFRLGAPPYCFLSTKKSCYCKIEFHPRPGIFFSAQKLNPCNNFLLCTKKRHFPPVSRHL